MYFNMKIYLMLQDNCTYMPGWRNLTQVSIVQMCIASAFELCDINCPVIIATYDLCH